MTTHSQSYILLFFSLFCFLMYACEGDSIDESITESQNCDIPKPERTERQYIVQFNNPTNAISLEKKIDIIDQTIAALEAGGDRLIKRCNCEQEILLMEMPEGTINQVERKKGARDKVDQTSANTATLLTNIEIEVEAGTQAYQNLIQPPVPSSNRSNKTTIAVIDGGINTQLLPFENRLWNNPAELGPNAQKQKDDDNNCLIDDWYGYDFSGEQFQKLSPHGTRVASVLSNTFDQMQEVVGMNAQDNVIRLMDLKIFDEYGDGTLFDALCASHYAIDQGAEILNLSWGFYDDGNELHPGYQAFRQLLQRAQEEEVLVIAATGNDHNNIEHCRFLPAALADQFTNLISVAALNEEGQSLADFSNYGRERMSLLAPGETVLALDTDGSLVYVDGTSFAAPFVSALAALIHLEHSESPEQIKDRILAGATFIKSNELEGKKVDFVDVKAILLN